MKQSGEISGTKKKILSMLSEDGRKSLVDIARALGITHVAVRKHLSQLEEQGILRVRAEVSPEKTGLKLVLVFMEIEDEEHMAEITRRFRECPRIVLLASMVGGYNLVALMVAENNDVLECISTVCAVRRMKGIRRSEVYLVSDLIEPRFLPLKVTAEKTRKTAPCGRNCLECQRYVDNKCLGCPATIHYRGGVL